MIVRLVRDQRANADDRVVDMLGKLVANGGADFVVALAVKSIGSSEPTKIGDRFEVPHEDVSHHEFLVHRSVRNFPKRLNDIHFVKRSSSRDQ